MPTCQSLPVVLLDKAGVLKLRGGHPWIYSDELASASASGAGTPPPATVGDGLRAGLVALEGPAGRRRDYAVHNPRSRIALRVVSRDPAADRCSNPSPEGRGLPAERCSSPSPPSRGRGQGEGHSTATHVAA